MAIRLYKHQLAALKEIRNGSILCGGVGSGKSRTALAYYYTRVGKGSLRINDVGKDSPVADRVPLYVITTARKRDTKEWELETAPFRLVFDADLNPEGVDFTVDSWNNIEKYVDVADAFFIFDEQRVVGNGKWSKCFIRIAKANRWILLSATPGDTWMDYISVFVANGYFRNKTEFLKKHVVFKRFTTYPKVDHYMNEQKLEALRDKTLVHMISPPKAEKRYLTVPVEHDKTLMLRIVKDRWDIFNEAPLRDAAAYCSAMRKLVNSDASRAAAAMDILKRKKKAIVFYNFDYELDILRKTLSDASFLYAEWNGHKHEPLPHGGSWAYLVQYTAGAEGWNCTQTDTIIFYSQNYSYKVMVQAAGRIDRLNTPYKTLYYYNLVSDSKIDKDISSALKRKEDFNERAFYGQEFGRPSTEDR